MNLFTICYRFYIYLQSFHKIISHFITELLFCLKAWFSVPCIRPNSCMGLVQFKNIKTNSSSCRSSQFGTVFKQRIQHTFFGISKARLVWLRFYRTNQIIMSREYIFSTALMTGVRRNATVISRLISTIYTNSHAQRQHFKNRRCRCFKMFIVISCRCNSQLCLDLCFHPNFCMCQLASYDKFLCRFYTQKRKCVRCTLPHQGKERRYIDMKHHGLSIV